jgi:hypothetical protein
LTLVNVTAGRGGFLILVFATDKAVFHVASHDLRITDYVLQSLA